MSAKRLFKSVHCLGGALALASVALAFGPTASAEAAAKQPARYYFEGLCASSSSCNELLMKVPDGKRFDIRDVSCRGYMTGSGDAVKMALWVMKKATLKSIHDFVPTYTGMNASSRYYVGGRMVNAWAGPKEKLQLEAYGTEQFASIHCTVTGDMVTLN